MYAYNEEARTDLSLSVQQLGYRLNDCGSFPAGNNVQTGSGVRQAFHPMRNVFFPRV
jgi:hypothetical protein